MKFVALATVTIQASALFVQKSHTHFGGNRVNRTDPVDRDYAPDESGRCAGRLRCIKVTSLPKNYCYETHQVNWCKDYVNQPACIQADNYEIYISDMEKTDVQSGRPGFGRDSLEIECDKTRGHSTFPKGNVNWSPPCKDNTIAGRCTTWNTGGTNLCPICGDGSAGQDGGAAADNDVTGGGLR